MVAAYVHTDEAKDGHTSKHTCKEWATLITMPDNHVRPLGIPSVETGMQRDRQGQLGDCTEPWWKESESESVSRPRSGPIVGSETGATLIGARVSVLWNRAKGSHYKARVQSYEHSKGLCM